LTEEQFNPYSVRTKDTFLTATKLIESVPQLLVPTTEGFDQVNLDMTFTYLGNFELMKVDTLSTNINICHIYNLKQSEYILRGQLATLLNSRRSRNAKSMDMFTTITTRSEQKYEDKTEQQHGFNFFGLGRKKQG